MPKLLPINIGLPGFFGLNTRQNFQGTLQWATTATNCVIDASGRLAARKGRKHVTASAVGGGANIKAITEQVDDAGVTTVLSACNKLLWSGTGTLTDITGLADNTTGITDDHWQFQNIIAKMVGFQDAHDPVVRSTGDFDLLQQDVPDWLATTSYAVGDVVKGAAVDTKTIYFHATSISGTGTSGGAEPTWPTSEGQTVVDNAGANQITWTTRVFPNGNVCHSAFGRIWVTRNGDVSKMYFSDTLLPHKFSGGQGGSLDLSLVWGADEITAISSVEDYLVIFGKKNIAIYSGAGTPSTMTLQEKLSGIGCVARDSVASTGNDLIFLSDSGVRVLSRAIESGGRQALGDWSVNVRSNMLDDIDFGTPAAIKAVYDEFNGFYILSLTSKTVDYVFDVRFPNEDGSAKVTTWDSFGGKAFYASRDRKLYVGDAGIISQYDGFNDGASGQYNMTFISTWSDYRHLEQQVPMIANRFKFPKRWVTYVLTGTNYNVTWLWGFDYSPNLKQQTTQLQVVSTPAEWNVSEWNIGEWSGGDVFSKMRAHPTGHGVALRIGWRVTIDGAPFAIQNMDFGITLGRVQ